jgi:hypothetical protein
MWGIKNWRKRETQRHRDRQTDRQADRQRQTQRGEEEGEEEEIRLIKGRRVKVRKKRLIIGMKVKYMKNKEGAA